MSVTFDNCRIYDVNHVTRPVSGVHSIDGRVITSYSQSCNATCLLERSKMKSILTCSPIGPLLQGNIG